LQIGGIVIETGKALGRDLTLEACARNSTRCSSGMGLAGVNALRAPGEDKANVRPTRSISSPACGRPTAPACPWGVTWW
jgi:hypothetical protein